MIHKALTEELQKWADAGHTAAFWWRDDDVQAPSVALSKLLAISQRYRAPLSLAAVPDGLRIELPAELSGFPDVNILQHGFSHRNHAPEPERKMELGWHRPADTIRHQIRSGLIALQGLFGEHFVAVLVPPWNRIDERVVELLPGLGLVGLSTLGPRTRVSPVIGINQLNVHVDIMNWQDRCFAGERVCIDQILAHLQAKRQGRADREEPTGIMSHHLVHDAACWRFLDELFHFLSGHPGVSIERASNYFRNQV